MSIAHPYLSHGGKSSRRKRVKRLIDACESSMARYSINDIRQLGKRHVLWHDEQLKRTGKSDKTRMEYHYAWCTLWELLNRLGKPPRPKL